MVVAALLGREALTARKTLGVVIAVGGVAIALATGLAGAPAGAWRGDLTMAAGTLCMAFYNVWSRPFMARSSLLGFLAAGMGFGGGCSTLIAWQSGGLEAAALAFGPAQWAAVIVLGVFGGAAAFYLWVFALQRTTPTRVANTMTVNPIAASLLAVSSWASRRLNLPSAVAIAGGSGSRRPSDDRWTAAATLLNCRSSEGGR
jgi:drug/metabolite transporter (DMT)-like permease